MKEKMKIFFKRLFKEKPLGTFGFFMTCIFIFVGIFAKWVAPYGFNDTQVMDKFLAPCAKYIMGTDNLGRDVFSRVIYGTQTSIFVGLVAAVISVITGTLIGVSSGYIGGRYDLFIQRIVDAIQCLPLIVLLMILISMVGANMISLTVVIGVRSGIAMSRIIRSATIGVKNNVYVKASLVTGCSRMRTIFKHIIPNIQSDILIVFATRIPSLILLEASLSYLGYGVVPPTPSWGGMISGVGVTYMYRAPWMVLWPGLALVLLVFCVNMFADALRDLVDPKLRGFAGASDFRLPSKRMIKKLVGKQ